MIFDDEALEIIEGKNLAYLATSMADGSPHISPVWIDHDGNTLLVNTVPGRVKQKNVSRDPRVAISMVQEKNPYRHLFIRGKVVEQTQQGALDHIDWLARKYLGKAYPWNDRNRIILRIKPESVKIILD
ncbi:MAG TPA: PPOX class F420-dependent oxidoreductase [Candidatus Acidoferrales bacterium]|nr:PPOX class F420-dependent oxidoreductase [Candidatus Acidoferrales bacterium]